MDKSTSNLLRDEIREWERLDFLDPQTSQELLERYDGGNSWVTGVFYWVSLLGVLTFGLGILGIVGLLGDSALLAAFIMAAASIAAILAGGKFTTQTAGDPAYTGTAILTIGVLLFYGSISLLQVELVELPDELHLGYTALVTAVVGLGVGYLYARRWPVLLGLLFFFHGLDVATAYLGHGGYGLFIDQPLIIAPVSLLFLVLGIIHESDRWARLHRYPGFGQQYVIIGLLFVNLSLWRLSFPGDGSWFTSITPTVIDVLWIMAFAAASILQIAYGARQDDGRFVGFGVVFLAINGFTRYYELFWDQLSLGLFFLLGGFLFFALGVYFEYQFLRQLAPWRSADC